MKLKSAAAVTAAAFEWLSDKEAGFFFGRTEAWLYSFRWTFTRLPQLRLSPLPVSYETHSADAPRRPPLIGRRCSSLTSWAAAAAASRRSRPVAGQVHVCFSEHRRGCAACLLSPPHLHNMSCQGEESKIGGTASRQQCHRYLHLAAHFVYFERRSSSFHTKCDFYFTWCGALPAAFSISRLFLFINFF